MSNGDPSTMPTTTPTTTPATAPTPDSLDSAALTNSETNRETPKTQAPPKEADVLAMLRGVIDPELNVDIVELGMVERIDVSPGGFVEIVIALTIAGCPLKAQIKNDAAARVRSLPGVSDLHISFGELNAAQRSQVMQRARLKASQNAPETEVSATTRIVAIASGKGGVGKSSVTCNLAAALAARRAD
jgi:ATP-binding protein involved in chromosome partitioning